MAFNRFQDFLGGLVSRQRSLFSKNNKTPTIDELLDDLMGNTGEVSAIVAARELLDVYAALDEEGKLGVFSQLEQNYNADPASVSLPMITLRQLRIVRIRIACTERRSQGAWSYCVDSIKLLMPHTIL